MTPEDLRAAVLARHRSIHAFCRVHPELKRATVYMVLAGSYPGNTARQEARIREALGETQGGTPWTSVFSPERVAATLQACKCAHCRRPDRRGCRGCRNQTAREVAALQDVWGNHVQNADQRHRTADP